MNYINSIFPNINFSFQLSPIDRSILNLLHKIIMRTNLAYNYKFNYHTQKIKIHTFLHPFYLSLSVQLNGVF